MIFPCTAVLEGAGVGLDVSFCLFFTLLTCHFEEFSTAVSLEKDVLADGDGWFSLCFDGFKSLGIVCFKPSKALDVIVFTDVYDVKVIVVEDREFSIGIAGIFELKCCLVG